MATDAFRVLREHLDGNVMVRLKGGKVITGILKSFDQHLNLILAAAEEVDGQETRPLGTILIRGDNVVLISPAPKE